MTQASKYHETLLITILLIGCVMPSMSKYCDDVSVRWYVSGFMMCLLCLYYLFNKRYRWKIDRWNPLLMGAFVALLFELCFVVVEFYFHPKAIMNYGACGSFDNPGELSFVVCSLLPILWVKPPRHNLQSIRVGFIVLAVIIVMLTQSRTGIVVVMLLLFLRIARECNVSGLYKTSAAAVLCLMALFLIMTRKTDSNRGRAFILRRTWELIEQRPFWGHGRYGFERMYMQWQADYFRVKLGGDKQTKLPLLYSRSDNTEAWLADDVRHPLNEYAYVWVNYGVFGPLALLVLFGIPVLSLMCGHHGSLLNMSLLPAFLFSFSSCPLQSPLPWILVAFYYGSTLCVIIGKSVWIVVASLFLIYEAKLVSEDVDFIPSPVPCYNKARKAFGRGELTSAFHEIDKCRRMWDGYNVQLLMADIFYYMSYQQKDNVLFYLRQAEEHYLQAAYMCPVRFAPLEGLYRVYQKSGDLKKLDSVKHIIARKQMKVVSVDGVRIKKIAR